MIRASFTITDKRGVSWDGNHLAIGLKSMGEEGMISVLNFISSGQMQSIPTSWIASVTFHAAGAQHCGECDGSLWSMVGHGIHKNPGPPT